MADINVREVLERVAKAVGAEKDADLAAALRVPYQTLATWKKRNKIPYEQLFELAEQRAVSLDYLLLGKSPHDLPVSMTICKEIRKALESKYSPVRGRLVKVEALIFYVGHTYVAAGEEGPRAIDPDVFAVHLVKYYVRHAHVRDPEERKRNLLLDMLQSRQSRLPGEIDALQRLMSDQLVASSTIRQMLDESKSLLTEIDQVLSDEGKFRATVEMIWREDTDESTVDDESISPVTAIQAETTSSMQTAKKSSHRTARSQSAQKRPTRKK